MTALSESFTPLLGWPPPPFPPHHTAPQPTPPSPLGILGVGLDSVTIFKIEMCLKKYYPSYNYRRKRSLDNELAWERQFLCILYMDRCPTHMVCQACFLLLGIFWKYRSQFINIVKQVVNFTLHRRTAPVYKFQAKIFPSLSTSVFTRSRRDNLTCRRSFQVLLRTQCNTMDWSTVNDTLRKRTNLGFN